jgi:hypothetical protein
VYDVAHWTGVVEPIEPFAGPASSGFAGLAFAPGERPRVRLNYKILPGTADARLRGAVRVRSLPDDAVAVATVEVDPAATAAEPASLEGSLSAPVHGVCDRVEASGLAVAVHAVEYPVELSNRMPPPGFEHLAVNPSVENDTEPPGPVVVGPGRFGGMALVDPAGAEFVEDRRFDGTLAGGAYYEDSTAVLPGGINDGTAVVAVPIDATPLRLFWTPPAALWRAGSGVAVNRYVWRPR